MLDSGERERGAVYSIDNYYMLDNEQVFISTNLLVIYRIVKNKETLLLTLATIFGLMVLYQPILDI